MEHWLAIDLSSPNGTLSVHRVEEGELPVLLQETKIGDAFQHSERFLDALDTTLRSQRLELAAIDRYLTPLGPGSFTGLRIALASLKAFSLALQKPIETVSASEARALAWLDSHPLDAECLLVLTHISMDKYVHSRFSRKLGGKVSLQGEKVIIGLELSDQEKLSTHVLMDERSFERLKPDKSLSHALFPLRANHLGIALPSASSRRTHGSLEELIILSPQYYGDAALQKFE
jgi:tRNA threonylcarbamoyl adenosine modification protein YeaZ